MLFLYALTLFASAVMLFMSELMFAKMILPLLGGTPAVWNTCTVFFQMALLAGYAYAHIAVSKLKIRSQVLIHLVLLLVPLALLPIAIPHGWRPPSSVNPVASMLLLMSMTIGLPFLMVSTSAPLIQRWFAHTDHPAAKDPYFLYAASNAGSFVGLIGYLLFFEPRFTLGQQSLIWKYGYIGLITLTAICAATVLVSLKRRENALNGGKSEAKSAADAEIEDPEVYPAVPVTPRRVIRWLILALIPSSLMLGFTTFLTTDIAAVPLLWVMPLSLYLLSFVIAFSRREYIPQRWLVNAVPILVLLQAVALVPEVLPMPYIAILHMTTFFIIALACHRELANDRPSAEHLTRFYLMLSVGGMLGGMFNALVAPVVFKDAYEYLIVLVLASVLFLRRKFTMDGKGAPKPGLDVTMRDAAWMVGFGAVAIGILHFIVGRQYPDITPINLGMWLIIIAGACYTTYKRPVLFGAALGITLVLLTMALKFGGEVVYQNRSFFGVLDVKYDREYEISRLWHGTTIHGIQCLKPEFKHIPISYFYPTGPVGQLLSSFEGPTARKNMAVLGLGAGTLAAYGGEGQKLTFYEIDPLIRDVATNPKYFTYITDARARGLDVKIVLGDGRLTIADAPERSFDFIALDAFSSDAIPMHLLTKEALDMYVSKLTDNGVIAFNITNRYVNIEPVLGNLAADAGLACMVRYDVDFPEAEWDAGKFPSAWVLIAPHEENFGELLEDFRWLKVERDPKVRAWTDDFTNLIQVLMWFQKED